MAKTPFREKVARTVWLPMWQDAVLAGLPNASHYIEGVLNTMPEFTSTEAAAVREQLASKKNSKPKKKK